MKAACPYVTPTVNPSAHGFPAGIEGSTTLGSYTSIPGNLTVGQTFVAPDTGVEVTKLANSGEGVYVTKQSWNADGTLLFLQNPGRVYSASPPFTNLTGTAVTTSHSVWSTVHPEIRYGRNSGILQAEDVNTGTLTPVLDQAGNTIPTNTLGDSKGTISRNDSLITVDSGTNVTLYEFTGKFTVQFKGSIDVSGYTSYNGAIPSPLGDYVAVYDVGIPNRCIKLYNDTGGFIGDIPGSSTRSQHGDWALDDFNRSVWVAHEAEQPSYYIPDTNQLVWLNLDMVSSDGRYGNGFVSGQNWNRPGYVYVATGESNPNNLIVAVKLQSDFTTTRTLPVPNDNTGGSIQVTGFEAVEYVEPWIQHGGGTDEITVSLDGRCMIVDSTASGIEAPYLVCCPGYAEDAWGITL